MSMFAVACTMAQPHYKIIDYKKLNDAVTTVKRIVIPEGKACRTRYRVIREQDGGALILWAKARISLMAGA